MNTTSTRLKIAAAVGAIWYAFGLLQFSLAYAMNTAVATEQGAMTPAHAAAIDGTPLIIWIAFALASLAGLVGSILLFINAPSARIAFLISLISAVVYYVWIYVISGTGGARPSEELIIAAVVITVTVAFNVISRRTA